MTSYISYAGTEG